MTDRVLLTVSDHVAHVRLNRPDKRNGLDLPMFQAIVAAGRAVTEDASVRAVVLSGEGKVFCAGLDWGSFFAGGSEAMQALLAREGSPANLAQRVAWIWQEVSVPVIAAVHGSAFGGGLQIALGADVRYAAPDTQLSVMEVRYGIVPDMGITRTFPGVVRSDALRELVFTGRVVDAAEGERIGLVTRVCADPLAEAMRTAREIAGRSPSAVRAAKRMLRESLPLDPAASFLLETAVQMELLGTPDQLEAAQATMLKREAVFRG